MRGRLSGLMWGPHLTVRLPQSRIMRCELEFRSGSEESEIAIESRGSRARSRRGVATRTLGIGKEVLQETGAGRRYES